jgi:FkbM family methyltransferase
MKGRRLKILNIYYSFVGDTDVIKYLAGKGINISWVVEAGCHDGEDTLRINAHLKPSRIIAFEPDEHARLRAVQTYAANNLDVEVHNFGLSDKNSKLFLNFLNGQAGTGSTYLAETGSSSVEVKRLNDLNLNLGYGGMLWLDVEGHAIQALRGASDYLSNLAAAKVEIQMHKMSDARVADYFEVNQIMKAHGLIPVRVPVYPGFFGDVIYLNKKESKFVDRIWSALCIFQMKVLHGFVFPVLGKPKSL